MGRQEDYQAAVTSGDVGNREYWHAKYASQKVDNALETRQPEGAIKDYLPEAIKAYDAALAGYPNHQEIKKWKDKAVMIQGKINPHAERARFQDDFHWDNYRFEYGWVAFHWAKFAAQIEDWDEVYSQAQLAFSYFGMCRAEKNFGRWSDDIKKWMADADTEAERIWDISREHRPYP